MASASLRLFLVAMVVVLSCLATPATARAKQQLPTLTFPQEIEAAISILKNLPSYSTLLSRYELILTQVVLTKLAQAVTVLVGNNTAVAKALADPTEVALGLNSIVRYHVLLGLHRQGSLRATPANTPLATVLGKRLLKSSPKGVRPIRFWSPGHSQQARIVRRIFVGKHLAVFAIDSVLHP